jgi:hypothetical protein
LELLGFKPFRNLSAGEEPAAGGDDGRLVGIGSPCDDMQLRNDFSAVAKPLNPPPPPNPPNPPPEGRSDAQALLAFSNVLLPDEPPNPPPNPPPPKPPGGGPDGRVVGTFTPCWRRQLRYAPKPDEDELPAAELPDVAPQPATSSTASPKAPATHAKRPPRLPSGTRTCISSPRPRGLQQDQAACRTLTGALKWPRPWCAGWLSAGWAQASGWLDGGRRSRGRPPDGRQRRRAARVKACSRTGGARS